MEQLMDRLKTSFRITGDIFDFYTELRQFCIKNRKNVVDYINRDQTVYNNIIEAERSMRGRLTNADITRINNQFVHSFYSELPNIWTLVEKQNDLPLAKMYEMIEKANQELQMKYESQRVYTFSYRFPRYESGAPEIVLREANGKIKKNDHSRQDLYEQFNDKPISRVSNSSKSRITGNERNLKQCHYKNIGHETEECRKRQYNKSRNNSSGNSRNSSRSANGPQAGSSKIYPVNVIEIRESEEENTESQ